MSKFGWSYPPGAASDPCAPYNQDFDDEHCLYCGADLENTWPVETEEDEIALDEGYCNAKCQDDYEQNGFCASETWGKPQLSIDQKDRLQAIQNKLYEHTRKPLPAKPSLDSIISHCPDGDFKWDDGDPGDAHVYCCGEKDCPQQWHLSYDNTEIRRVDGKLYIDVYSGDSDGDWDIVASWEEGEDWNGSEVGYYFSEARLNDYFIGWAEYWIDAAISGEDPCRQLMDRPKKWVDSCLNHAENSIKYL